MDRLALLVVVGSVAVLAATWVVYPAWLRVLATGSPLRVPGPRASWPQVTIVVVVRNAEPYVRDLLDHLLALAYPRDLRRILVVSDASDDFTDAVVGTYADHGVELLRVMRPVGRANALNLARRHLHSTLVAVVDASARPRTSALAALVRPFGDPVVGVAFARELPAPSAVTGLPPRETMMARYEERVRDLETRVFGTVSARGSMYAVRWPIFLVPLRPWLSTDFALALAASDQGLRAVYVKEAECVAARPPAPAGAFTRTVWAVSHDVATLLTRPRFLDPRRVGPIAWELLAHKLGRWLTPWALAALVAGLTVLAPTRPWALWTVIGLTVLGVQGIAAALVPGRSRLVDLLAVPGRVALSALATAWGSFRALRLVLLLRLRPLAAR